MNGITLIELSVALSLLAVLAAVLLPRIAQLQRAARVGELRYLQGIVSARTMLVHSAVRLRQASPDSAPCTGGGIADNHAQGIGTVCTEAGLVPVLHGYPTALPAGDGSAARAARHFHLSEAEFRTERFGVRAEPGRTHFMRLDAPQPEGCAFTYSQALDATTAAAISVPVTSGC
jgi:MSHA pilin protein MshA